MNSSKIRYQNTQALIRECGSITLFANKLGKAETQVSSFAGANPRKGIGNKIARQIEECFGKSEGWLDVIHDHESSFSKIKDLMEKLPENEQARIVAMVEAYLGTSQPPK